MIPSPTVSTYDLQPEMSAQGVAERVCDAIRSRNFPFVMCNFAPPDMVGHTGKYMEAVRAIEATDAAIGLIWETCKKENTILVVTADHGNAEKMLEDNKVDPFTAHTTAKVPLVLAIPKNVLSLSQPATALRHADIAALCDVAPTILALMNIEKPVEMTGTSLLLPPTLSQ